MCAGILISEEKEVGSILNDANAERHNTLEKVKVTRPSRPYATSEKIFTTTYSIICSSAIPNDICV